MYLRRLKEKDSELMLEWMHDLDVVNFLQTDFSKKEINDCELFIKNAENMNRDIHLAIVNDQDEYLGTVSLKHLHKGKAEFGITVRKCAMGTGIAIEAMKKIFFIAFNDLGLHEIYWCVNKQNLRAIKFYDKNNFQRININDGNLNCEIQQLGYYTKDQIENYLWYHFISL